MGTIIPRTKTPELEISTLDGSVWSLAEQRPETFTLVVAYRGLHCPICKTYLQELNRTVDEFKKRGVNVVALSSDTQERAQTARDEWKLDNITIGYGLSIEKAREWGLFISTSRGKTSAGIEEPTIFSEPGVFIIRPDQTLFASNIATMPFARPHFREMLAAIDFIIDKNYPARGEA
ncbi:MAG: AhpC/TSA family protein [Chloroflexi bacterium AL-W]|nr:AhpC/TSA family protein [Chloroflexi bacterium AL-N1]NOK65402.1 AhpC/TSA family protein [Chloroflexi bacterium AL-N10]NOK72332.1 AhpC/TSA family protein [Chloroflexi bacterium AL-N5]NOK79581.1 AhpC/TSA family protein [Chloroflexi bacterium AL-W]NOK87497.1 AhpC/TSA family protein [Chloroflexi bacterium AL-N15]